MNCSMSHMKSQELAFPLWDGGNSQAHTTQSCFCSGGFHSNGDGSWSSSTSYSFVVCSLVRPTLPLSRALAVKYLNSLSLKNLLSYLPALIELGLGGKSPAFSAGSLLERLPSREVKPPLPHLKSSQSIPELKENVQPMRTNNVFLKTTTPCAALSVF